MRIQVKYNYDEVEQGVPSTATQCAQDLLSCISRSNADAKYFAESGLAEALGVKEEDIREKLLKINYRKSVHPAWGYICDKPDLAREVLDAIVRVDADGDAKDFAINSIRDNLRGLK